MTTQYKHLPVSELTTTVKSKLVSVHSFSWSDNLRFHKQLNLERLSYLALGDTLLNQFEISPKKALNFLLDPNIGLLVIGKILTPIEVGIVYEADWEHEGQADLPELREDEYDNEFTFTVSGRHRITALLTWAYVNGIDPKEITVPVTVTYHQTWEDAALAVLAANASRTMTPTEKLNVTVQSRQVDTQDINQLALSADSSKHAKEAFILLASSQVISQRVGLQRNTLASLARSFLTLLAKHKGVLTWFSNPEVLSKMVSLFVSSLEAYLKHNNYSNVARNAVHVGKLIYSMVNADEIMELGREFNTFKSLNAGQKEDEQHTQPIESAEQTSQRTEDDDDVTADLF